MEPETRQPTTTRQLCACCEIEIDGEPVVRDGRAFCCEGCAAGGPCTCDYNRKATALAKAEPTEPAAPTRGDVVTALKDCLNVLEGWQAHPGETPPTEAAPVLTLVSKLRPNAANRPATPPAEAEATPTSQPAPRTATLSVTGLTPGKPLQELILQLQRVTPGRPFSLEMTPGGVTVFHLEAKALGPLCEAVASLSDYHITSLWQDADGASIALEEAAPAPATPTAAAVPAAAPAPARDTAASYEIGVDTFLNGRHYLASGPDETHPHSWRIQARLRGNPGDEEGGLIGFEDVRSIVEDHITPYKDKLLNRVAPFDTVIPTTENMAAVFYERVAADLATKGVKLDSLCLWETPTSYVVYRGEA